MWWMVPQKDYFNSTKKMTTPDYNAPCRPILKRLEILTVINYFMALKFGRKNS